ncbi:uncharacterized protein LOC119720382 [Patiria miniata]|uniref:Uncharacterized protein n=1 Tax=Patiria miniata TaxID=46514 RepID=A0A913Z292_PATMI|nr:uncharacterized protein LOC119720382 [Patiria miniata]
MMLLSRKTSRALSIFFICLAIVGFYVYLNSSTQDEEHVRTKQSFDITPTLGRTVHPSDVRTASINNDTEAEKGPAKIDPETVQAIDSGNTKVESIEKSRVDKNFIDLDQMDAEELFNRTAIVTAISQNHFRESKGMIGSVQEILPHKKIIVYDLGLTPQGVTEAKRLCNVELRSFDFSKYPPHVKNLYKYSWKPLIIRDALEEFGVVFWGDASARIQKDPLVLFPVLKQQQGFMAIVEQYGSSKMLARTNPKMFKELQINMEKFVKDDGYSMCMEGNRLLFANTPQVQTKIIEPWVECALREECIAPAGSVRGINQKKPDKHTHRYDQAALALIVYRNLRGLLNQDNDQSKLFFSVAGLTRSAKGSEKAKNCKV